jgi:hypothetical protein
MILEGELPDPGDPDVVSILRLREVEERSKVQPPMWDLVCH